MAGEQKTAPLDAQIAEKLLDRLGSDDSFREQFQANPIAALQSIGYEGSGLRAAAPSDLAEPFSACAVNQLAAKEDILAAKEKLMATLTQGLAYNTPTFEAENLERRTRK